jgi:malonate-semialdehyde dehydrogenase (acetylating)/methylmalonate-semialdehyde dehydrogenase
MKEAAAASIGNYIGGKVVAVKGVDHLPVLNPATGEAIASVPMSRGDAVDAAVKAAIEPQREWAHVGLKDRVQVMYRLKTIIEERLDELAELVTSENGKTVGESKGELLRGVECIEFAASLPQIAAGQVMEVSRGVECKMLRYPLGVVASITPFNFPLMVPLWTAPVALALGNALVLKPSEQTPLSGMKLAELFEEAGLPKGVMSVVNGGRDVVEAICDHPGISAISFVGSTRVAKAVYERASAHGKRVKALGGAKNHLVVMPDADPDMTAANVVASATGCAGQRCMAASVLLAVKGTEEIVDKIKQRFASMKAGRDIGALISGDARKRISGYIERCTSRGAELAIDGREMIDASVSPDGNFLGPTLFDHAKPDHEVSCEEIFGPTLTVVRVGTLDEAIAIENANPYGNAAAIYTSSGEVASYFTERVSAGMIGINIGVPVPREPFPFGGWNDSSFGEGDLTGHGSFDFWTKSKKITTKWTDRNRSNWMS